MFREYVNPVTTTATDGYPLYHRAVREFGSLHLQVIHARRFIATEGIHINRIENLWSHLKQEYRARNG